MDNLFLPRSIDNRYRGRTLALWIFWVVVIIRAAQGVSLLVNGSSIVQGADGVPLETFPPAAAQSVVAMFVLSGSARLVLSIMAILVFVRYRSAVPLMLALLALDQAAKQLLLYVYPLYRVGNPIGPTVNAVLLALTFLGLVLSVWEKRHGNNLHQ